MRLDHWYDRAEVAVHQLVGKACGADRRSQSVKNDSPRRSDRILPALDLVAARDCVGVAGCVFIDVDPPVLQMEDVGDLPDIRNPAPCGALVSLASAWSPSCWFSGAVPRRLAADEIHQVPRSFDVLAGGFLDPIGVVADMPQSERRVDDGPQTGLAASPDEAVVFAQVARLAVHLDDHGLEERVGPPLGHVAVRQLECLLHQMS